MRLDRVKLGALSALVILSACSSSSSSGESSETPRAAGPPFADVAAQSGLDFWQYSGATGELFLPEIMGSGGALLDYDNDGDLDVYLVQGAPAPAPGDKPLIPPPAGWTAGNRLFRNDLIPGGSLSFQDVTTQAGVGYVGIGMGVAVGDYDDDGNVDLYVSNYESDSGANVLYHNNGDGTFTDVTRTAGVASSGWSSSSAFLDYDRDGLLDLAVVHYVRFYPRDCPSLSAQNDYCGPQNFQPTVTELYRNRGNGRFEDVTSAAGLNAKPGPGLGILTGDFDSNGWPDFLVANDGAANHLWLNQGLNPGGANGSAGPKFSETGLSRGVAYASDGRPRAGMGLTVGDIYGDGGESLVVTNLPGEGFTMFSRQASGAFTDATMQSGMFRHSQPYTGFGVGFVDIENRGLADLFSANGGVDIEPELLGEPYPYAEQNMLIRNLGKGKGFEDVTASAGPALEYVEVSRAAVFGDIDNDGGVDILITNNNGPARLLRNTAPNRGHWLLVEVEGTESNRSGYGSTVDLVRPDGTSLKRWVRSDGSYLSANDARVHFGLGDLDAGGSPGGSVARGRVRVVGSNRRRSDRDAAAGRRPALSLGLPLAFTPLVGRGFVRRIGMEIPAPVHYFLP